MRLTPRLTLTFIAYAAILLAVVGLLAYSSGRESLRSATISDLLSTAIEKQGALDEWVEEKRRDIAVVAEDPVVVGYAATLTASPPGSPEARSAHGLWLNEVQPRVEGGEFTDLLLLDAQTGQVLAATEASEEGTYKEDRPFFINGRIAPYVQDLYPSIALGAPAMTAAAPLRAPDGSLLGVLAGRLDPAELTTIIGRRTGLHQTDEAYLVNSSSLFVTQPRFISEGVVLQRAAQTEAVTRCLTGDSGVIDQQDYRGVPTIAVYRWLPERRLCLVVEMDQEEAYAPARALGRSVAVISALALLAAGALSVVLARTLTRPLRVLQATAERFGAGDRSLRMPSAGKDEIGDLSREFDRMVAALSQQEQVLRDHAQTLDEKVRQRTEALQASEEQLRTTMDSMLEGAQIIGFDWRYLYVNDAVAAQGKQAKDRLLGRTMMEAYPGIDQTDFFVALRRCMEQRETARLENEFAYEDGSKGWFELSLQPVPEGVFILSSDITERKRAEAAVRRHAERVEALNRVARIVSSSLELDEIYDGFVAELRRLLPVDRTSITHVDEAAERWTIVRQWTAVEPSMRPGDWHPLPGSAIGHVVRSAQPLIESPIDADNQWAESSLLRAEGMQSRIIVPLVANNRVTGTVSFAARAAGAFSEEDLDLVGPMAAHLALAVENVRLYLAERDYAAGLEQRVAERTMELEVANKELESFAYSVSHDLRAPLRAADGFSRILQEDYAADLDEGARRYLDLVRDSTQQMGRLIDDLLAFSRLGRQELARRAVQPSALARQALEGMPSERDGRPLEIEIEDMPEVQADPNLLYQVYVNLLSNALKFTRGRQPGRIQVGSCLVDGERAYFVRDNGAGFDMAYAGKLFGVFQRLHRAEEYEGTGVGLAIVQRVIHRHGGRVWAEAGVDRGATFYFTLPDGREG